MFCDWNAFKLTLNFVGLTIRIQIDPEHTLHTACKDIRLKEHFALSFQALEVNPDINAIAHVIPDAQVRFIVTS